MIYNEEKLLLLRESIKTDPDMSDKRRIHTLAVEQMAIRLGALFCPDKTDILRAAALLHDVTKEYSVEQHTSIYRENGIEPTRDELFAPKTLHAKTAALIIPVKYPDFADSEVISAVRWHTTGHEGMTLTEKLIYLADYIDESRKFEDCVVLRKTFFSAAPEKMEMSERLALLRDVLIMSYDMTVSALLRENLPISPDTVLALNELICEKATQGSTGLDEQR